LLSVGAGFFFASISVDFPAFECIYFISNLRIAAGRTDNDPTVGRILFAVKNPTGARGINRDELATDDVRAK